MSKIEQRSNMGEMKETQILFNGPMVQAILEGRKTQTRRVILKKRKIPGEPRHYSPDFQLDQFIRMADCPYGVPGDRLWVREAWRIASLPCDEQPAIQYRADNAIEWCDPFDPAFAWDMKWEDWYERMNEQLVEDCERAGLKVNINEDMAYTWDWDSIPTRWRPSIHIPRWASRITLEVMGIRVERVQDISQEDVLAGGIYERDGHSLADVVCGWHEPFAELWDSIYAKRGYGWAVNPWVWVAEFQHLKWGNIQNE